MTWIRLGVVISGEPRPSESPEEYVLRSIREERAAIDGHAYFPEIEENAHLPERFFDDLFIKEDK